MNFALFLFARATNFQNNSPILVACTSNSEETQGTDLNIKGDQYLQVCGIQDGNTGGVDDGKVKKGIWTYCNISRDIKEYSKNEGNVVHSVAVSKKVYQTT